jgi:two-component sensor histidine kinase
VKVKTTKPVSLSLVCALLCFSCILSYGQSPGEKVQSLFDSSYSYSRYDYDKCVEFVDSAQQIKNYEGETYYSYLSHYYLGICNHRHGYYNEALTHFQKGIESFESLADTSVLSDLYYQKSLVFRQQSDYKQFLENVNKSLSLAESIDYYKNIGMCNNAKLIHYNERKLFNKAEACGLKALEIFQAIQDSSSLGDVYNNLGVLMSAQNKLDEALQYHLLQHNLNLKLDNVWGQGYSHSKLAVVYASKGNFSLAVDHMNASLEITRKIGTPYELSGALINSAKLNSSMGFYEKARRDIHESIRLSKKFDQLNTYAKGLSELVEIHKNLSSLDSALYYSELLMSVKDSVINVSIGKQLNELEVKFETEKKDNAIKTLEYEDKIKQARINQQKIIIVSSLIGLGLLAFLFFRVKVKNQKIAEQNTVINTALKEKDMLLREIHHRVKNNLQMISSLLGIQSRTISDEKAKEAIREGRSRVHSMSLLHQNLYQKDNLSGVPMEDYLPKLCRSLFDTYNISGDRVKLTTEIEAIKLNIETVIPIGLIVNELITNSLKYTFPDGRQGEIKVRLKETESGIFLVVEDDGVGFPKAQLGDSHEGFGHSLIGAFKQKLDADIQFINNGGARVELLIRNYLKI